MTGQICPRCRRPVIRVQPAGPPGSAIYRSGPAIAYPCQCWLIRVQPAETTPAATETVRQAMETVRQAMSDVATFWERVTNASVPL